MDAKEAFRKRHRVTKGRVLVVGSRIYGECEDMRKRYKNAIGVDMVPGDGVDVVCDLTRDVRGLEKFDHIECLSVLEHVKQPFLMSKNLSRLANPGCSIFVMVPWIWRYHAYPDDYFRYTPNGIRVLFPWVAWEEIIMVANDKQVKGPGSYVDDDGNKYLERTEVFAFGKKIAGHR